MRILRFILLTVSALLATAAMAATNYNINVGGVEVTSSNAGNVTGGDIEFRSGGYVSYNASTNTLTLNNVYISRSGSNDRAVHNRGCDNLTIVLKGYCHFVGSGCSTLKLERNTTIDVQGGSEIECYSSGDDAIYLTHASGKTTTLTITGKEALTLKSSGGEGIAGSKDDYVVLSNANLTIDAKRGAFCDLETVRFNAQDNVTIDIRGIKRSSKVTIKPTGSSSYPHARNVNNIYTQAGVNVRTPSGAYATSLKTSSYYNQEFIISDEYNSSSYTAVGNYLFDSNGTLVGPTVSFKYSTTSTAAVPGYVYVGGGYKNVTIGNSAFYNLSNLTSVTLNYGVKSIGNRAFWCCSNLSTLRIPSSVTTIFDYAFCDTSLKTINWSTLNASTASVSSSLFSTDHPCNPTFYFPTQKAVSNAQQVSAINKYNVATSIDSYDFGFSNCRYAVTSEGTSSTAGKMALTGYNGSAINIGNTLGSYTYSSSNTGNNAVYYCRSVAEMAFYNNTTITNASLDCDYIETIEPSAFYGASSLKSLTTGRGLKQIGSNAFYNTALENLQWNTISFPDPTGYSAAPFNDLRNKIKTVSFGTSVEKVPAYLCYKFANVASLNFPSSVKTIGQQSFVGTAITTLIIPNTVTTIGYAAFSDCTKLSSVSIGTAVSSIGLSAFTSCNNIKTVIWNAINFPDFYASPFSSSQYSVSAVTIGPNVTRIPSLLCYNFQALKSVTIPSSVKEISYEAFSGSGLTTLNTSSVESIKYNAFANCGDLAAVTLGSKLKSLGNGVFSNCKALRSVTLPVVLSSMGTSVFCNCTSLATVTDNSGLYSIPDYTFQNCTALKQFKIRDGITTVGKWAFMGGGLTTLEIPRSVTKIGEMAFASQSLARIDSYPRSEDVTLGASVFYNVNKQTCQLHVRPSCLAKYKVADQWKDFYNKVGDLEDPDYNPYDVNNDGAVDVGDVNAVLEAILNNDKSAIYDINGDGNVDVGDVNAVLEYILSNG